MMILTVGGSRCMMLCVCCCETWIDGSEMIEVRGIISFRASGIEYDLLLFKCI